MSRSLDRTAVERYEIAEAPNDFAYWQTRPYEERLRAVTEIRQEYHGWDDESEPRLQRVVRVSKLA